jgi:hypothetical protein
MSDAPIPSLDDFLNAPLEEIARVAPAAVILAPGGTRRSRVLAGVAREDLYASWLRTQMIRHHEMVFRHGVRHIMTAMLLKSQFEETTPGYAERLVKWFEWGFVGPEAREDFQRLGWRVRLLNSEAIPALEGVAARLRDSTPREEAPTLWLVLAPDPEKEWRRLFDAVCRAEGRTREAVIRARYGADVPPATLFLSFGKPSVGLDLMPPLLMADRVECYWSQRPGYALTERGLRTILYDYAFLRTTWARDKTGRDEQVLAHRALWEKGTTLGVGRRVGPFWFPADEAGEPSQREEERP